MQTKPKSNSIITHSMQDGKIEFVVKDAGKLVFDMDKVSAQNRARAMIHGFVQRISDGGALSRNPETGKPATPEDKLARMARLADHLMSGSTEWAIKAQASAGPDSGLIVRAMVHAGLGADVEAIEALLAKTQIKRELDRAASLKLWAGTDKVLKAIAELKAAAAPKGADDLLAEMEAEDEPSGEEDSADSEEEAPF